MTKVLEPVRGRVDGENVPARRDSRSSRRCEQSSNVDDRVAGLEPGVVKKLVQRRKKVKSL